MALDIRSAAFAGALAAATVFAAPTAAAAAAPGASGPPGVSATAPLLASFDHSRFDPASAEANWGCRGWRCGRGFRRGWRGGWGGGWGGGWRRNRIDGGDVLIGAAILGGAIAIANSANRRRERDRDVVIIERDQRDWDRQDAPPQDNRRFDDRRLGDRRFEGQRSGAEASGLDNAVDQCLERIERDVRVGGVDDVARTGAGWAVSGRLFNGSPFQCRIGNDGQIEDIDYEGRFSAAPAAPESQRADGQWSDQRYADARLALGDAPPAGARLEVYETQGSAALAEAGTARGW